MRVLFDTDGVSVFDAPLGDTLLKTLRERGVAQISLVIISHADTDHLGGILSLLLTCDVRELYVNPDASKDTELWHDFRTVLKVRADEGHPIDVKVGLTTSKNGQLGQGDTKVEVLAPSPALALGGVGGKDLIRACLDEQFLVGCPASVWQRRAVDFAAGRP